MYAAPRITWLAALLVLALADVAVAQTSGHGFVIAGSGPRGQAPDSWDDVVPLVVLVLVALIIATPYRRRQRARAERVRAAAAEAAKDDA